MYSQHVAIEVIHRLIQSTAKWKSNYSLLNGPLHALLFQNLSASKLVTSHFRIGNLTLYLEARPRLIFADAQRDDDDWHDTAVDSIRFTART